MCMPAADTPMPAADTPRDAGSGADHAVVVVVLEVVVEHSSHAAAKAEAELCVFSAFFPCVFRGHMWAGPAQVCSSGYVRDNALRWLAHCR